LPDLEGYNTIYTVIDRLIKERYYIPYYEGEGRLLVEELV